MQTVNIHEAKTQLSRLIEQAVKGDSFIIAKAGKPLVKVIRLDAPSAEQIRRLGFMTGQITVPDDFDSMGAKEIELLFGGEEWSCYWIPACYYGRLVRLTGCLRAARPLLEDPLNELLFSAASLWEIVIKRGLGRSDFQVDARV
jgi:prevent-host-death family protein